MDPKRERGRPKGSSRFSVSDDRACEKAAYYMVKHPGSAPTEAFRKLGYNTDSELHRLCGKLRKNKAQYLEEAQARSDANSSLGIVGRASALFETAGDWVETIINSAPVEQLREEISNGKAKSSSLKKLGIEPEPPFDITDPAKIASAIARVRTY